MWEAYNCPTTGVVCCLPKLLSVPYLQICSYTGDVNHRGWSGLLLGVPVDVVDGKIVDSCLFIKGSSGLALNF